MGKVSVTYVLLIDVSKMNTNIVLASLRIGVHLPARGGTISSPCYFMHVCTKALTDVALVFWSVRKLAFVIDTKITYYST